MKEFWVRVISLFCIVSTILAYNILLDSRAKDDEIAGLRAKLEARTGEETVSVSDEEPNRYKDGVYNGEADGFGGQITVQVTVENGKIAAVDIVSADKEDGAYLTMAKEIIPSILEAQSVQVDTVSGATFSSSGIKNAVGQALEKAVK